MAATTGKAKVVNVAGVDPTTRLAAWALLGLTLLLDAGIIVLMTSTNFLNWEGSQEWGFGGASQYFQMVILTIEPLITAGLGMAILFRAANRRMGWLMMAIGCLGSLAGFSELHSAIAFGLQPEVAMPLKWPFAWLVRWLWLLRLVLIAVVMPDLNGVVATQRILGQNPTIGVIMLTMLEDDETVFAARWAITSPTSSTNCRYPIGPRQLSKHEKRGLAVRPKQLPMFQRGRLDHFALNATSEEAFRELHRRVMAEGRDDGEVTRAVRGGRWGGICRIESGLAGGTRVTIRLPCVV